MNQDPGAGLPTAGEERRGLTDQVVQAAMILQHYREQGRRGDLAELRRLRPGEGTIPPEVFWRLVERLDVPRPAEDFWLAILPMMVEHPHRKGAIAGRELARARAAPARVERWLRLDRERAWVEARRLLALLDGPIDWVRMGWLLLLWNDDSRRDFARDFFLNRPSEQDVSSPQAGDQ